MASRSVGRVSRMRVSSVTTASLRGTLKSTRMKTRLPSRSRSWMVSLSMIQGAASDERLAEGKLNLRPPFVANHSPLSSEFGGQQFDQVAATAGVAPLIVVPRQNFHATVADDFGVFGVDDR